MISPLARFREKNLHLWLGGWLRHRLQQTWTPRAKGTRHLLFAIADHFEPRWSRPSDSDAEQRVRLWSQGYGRLVDGFRDADGLPPRHTFFFPGEEYAPSYLDKLGGLARAGLAEVELHLHHHRDTGAQLRERIQEYLGSIGSHGHFSRDCDGRVRYAFVHGNWALCNGRPDGSGCGVDEELPILFETGCYADFTFPAAPDPAQPHVVNQIYWPIEPLGRRRAYEPGELARVGRLYHDRLLFLQGPLALTLRPAQRRVSIETADLTATNPPSPARIAAWVAQNIHVTGRPEWVFVKAFTHGAQEANAASLLGSGGHALHRELTTRYNDGRRWVLHYVSAREMYNVALAAMDGQRGDPGSYRDYRMPPPPAATP